MKIAICDDDINFLQKFEQLLLCQPTVTKVVTFSNASFLIEDVLREKTFDAIFLDIDWNQRPEGFSFAEQLERYVPHIPVIFITAYNDRFAQRVLLAHANLLGYLTKPINGELLTAYLHRIQSYKDSFSTILLMQRGETIALTKNRILYAESRNHVVKVYTEEACYTVYRKLSELYEEFSEGFAQCHKSYLVNLRRIRRLGVDSLTIDTGCELPVSRAYRAAIHDAFFDFMKKQLM